MEQVKRRNVLGKLTDDLVLETGSEEGNWIESENHAASAGTERALYPHPKIGLGDRI